jgi:hypothetical protein
MSVWTFRTPDIRECTTWPSNPTGWKTQVRRNMSRCSFCVVHTGLTPPKKIVRRHFTALMHRNALCAPQIPPDAETQVWRNMPQRPFCGIRSSPTREWKIVCQCFTPPMHQNALRELQSPPEAKTRLRCNESGTLFMETASDPPEYEKLCIDVSRPGRTRMHYVTHRSHRMQNTSST